MGRLLPSVLCFCLACCALAGPENLALRARVSASSQYSDAYSGQKAIDGVIPELLSHEDADHAWAVDGKTAGGKGWITLQWVQPVRVAEVIYYGRTSWGVEECWKEYEVLLDDEAEAAARGTFEMNSGPQRIALAPRPVRKVTLRFNSSYGGPNPGAAEIEVYGESPAEGDLPKLLRLPTNWAPRAEVWASSAFSEVHRAALATDGKIAQPFSNQDAGMAWATNGAQAQGKAVFRLQWPEPVTVADIVYYGRVAFLITECFREYEVWLDEDAAPAAKGQLRRGSGPQEIVIEARRVRKLELRFLSSYGGPNPGAEEIEVYDSAPPRALMPAFLEDGWNKPKQSPELADAVRRGELGFEDLLVIKRAELNPSHVYTACCEGFSPGGGLYVLSPARPDGELTELIASPEGQILDYDLSFDAREIVFSWRRRADEPYHLWRANVDGSELRQLTDGNWHDYNACWLPDGGIAFISTRPGVFAMCFVTPSGVLYRMDRDGGKVRRLSANYINDFTPSAMPDGRVLYSRWEYVDKPAIPIQSLWTICPDGSGLSVFYGNRVLSPASFLEARAVPGTESVLCTLTAHNGPIRGGLGLIDRRLGLNTQAALKSITPDIDIGRVDQGSGNSVQGPWEGPYPLDDRRLLASGKGSIYVGDYEGNWAIVKERGPDDTVGYYNPQPLRPRPRPPVVASGLEVGAPEAATVYLRDVYAGLGPAVSRGEVKSLCIVEEVAKPLRTSVLGFGFQRPVISCGATYAVKNVLGFTPVEADGSAHFRVPADRPVYFEALDAEGRAVQRMRSFAHFAPGESRGCVGCHEPRESTPPVARTTALSRPAADLTVPEWGPGNFDYAGTVQPVWDRHCVCCHSGPTAPARVDLSGGKTDWFNVSYDVLTRGYVNWIDTRNGEEANILRIAPRTWGTPVSKLTELILSGHLDGSGKPRVSLSPAERQRVFTWIDLNVPYYSTYEMVYPQAEGGRRIYPERLDGTWPAAAAPSATRRARCRGASGSASRSRSSIPSSRPRWPNRPAAASAAASRSLPTRRTRTTGKSSPRSSRSPPCSRRGRAWTCPAPSRPRTSAARASRPASGVPASRRI